MFYKTFYIYELHNNLNLTLAMSQNELTENTLAYMYMSALYVV